MEKQLDIKATVKVKKVTEERIKKLEKHNIFITSIEKGKDFEKYRITKKTPENEVVVMGTFFQTPKKTQLTVLTKQKAWLAEDFTRLGDEFRLETSKKFQSYGEKLSKIAIALHNIDEQFNDKNALKVFKTIFLVGFKLDFPKVKKCLAFDYFDESETVNEFFDKCFHKQIQFVEDGLEESENSKILYFVFFVLYLFISLIELKPNISIDDIEKKLKEKIKIGTENE